MSLTLSFFVSSILSAYWNGAATYYRGLARAVSAELGAVFRVPTG